MLTNPYPPLITRGMERTRVLTFFSKQERVECQVIGGEVDPALTRHSAFPAAAGVMSHQFFFQWEAEPLLKSHHCLAETGWVIFQRRLANYHFLSDKALRFNTTFV